MTTTTPAQLDWTRTAPAPLAAWRSALKVGDQVGIADLATVTAGDQSVEVRTMTVLKVTPSGQICVEPGNGLRFTPQTYRGSGRWATYSIFPLVEEAPVAEEVVKFTTPPTEGTITVIPSPVRVTSLEDGRLVCQTPYHEDFVAFCKAKKGRFSEEAGAKMWTLDAAHKEEVTRKLVEIWGVDGSSSEIRAYDVRVELDIVAHEQKRWWYLGREIAWRGGYDWAVKTDGVKVVKGAWERTGGTRSKPRVTAETGTVIEVRGVPMALALREGEARGWVGVSLIKREEGEEVTGPSAQLAPKPIVKVSDGLGVLVHPQGRPVEVEVLALREVELGQLDDIYYSAVKVLDKIEAEPGGREEHALSWSQASLLVEGMEALETAMRAADYAFWRARLDRSRQGGKLRRALAEWIEEVSTDKAAPAGADRDAMVPILAALWEALRPAAPVEEVVVEQAAPVEEVAALELPVGHLALDTLRLDERTQLRAARSAATLDEYASRMALDASGEVVDPAGRAWPAVVVYSDAQGVQWVADGHHRVEAAQRAGLTSIQVEVVEGELRDAVMYAASANTRHGLRLTTADKRRAITAVLSYPEGWEMSDRAIAALCGASHPTVAAVKRELRPELYEQAEEVAAPAPVEVVEEAVRVEDLLDEREEAEERDQVERVEREEEEAEPIEEQSGPARDLLPALIPFGALDSAPVEADQVRALRTYLGLSMTRFGELLGSSRQRVAVWEEQGTGTAHPPVNALLRLYLASILSGKESAPQAPVQPSAPAEAAPDEPDPGAPAVEASRGVEGFGWSLVEGSLRYRTPYKVEIAKALQTTPGAVWDGYAWLLPATPESVELLQTLVRRHWGVELGEQLLTHRIDGVARGTKGEPGELIQLYPPGHKTHPDGLWGRVIASNTWHETDDGWIDQYVLDLYLERVTAQDDPDVAEQLATHKAKLGEQAAALAQWEERLAAGAARAEEIRAGWVAQGLRRLEQGERLVDLDPHSSTRLHRWDLSSDGRLYAELSEGRLGHKGREVVIGREWAHVAFDDDRSETWAAPELILAAPPVEPRPLAVPRSTAILVEASDAPGPAVGQTLLVEAHVYGPPHKRWVGATVTGIGKTICLGADAAEALGVKTGTYSRTLWLRAPSGAELARLSPEDAARLGRRTDDLSAPPQPQQMAPVPVSDTELPAAPTSVTVWSQARGGKGGAQVGQTFLHPVGQHWLALTVLKRGRPTYYNAEDSSSVGPLMDGGWSIPLTVRAATTEEIKTLGDQARLVGTQRT